MAQSENDSMNQGSKKTLRKRLEGKKNMIALWTAVIGMFSAQGIPKIIELLENKPSTEQVQAMIAKQTEKLSEAQRVEVEVIQELDKRLSELFDDNSEHRAVTGQLEGAVSLLRDVLRDCCTRRRARERLDEKPAMGMGVPGRHETVRVKVHAVKPMDKPEAAGMVRETIPDALLEAMKKKPPVERLEKVPEFNMQQQLQMQEPAE